MRRQTDAWLAIEQLRQRYPAFLLDTLRVRDPSLADALRGAWTRPEGPLVGEPFVESAFPFEPGPTLAELRAPTVAGRPCATPDRPLHPATVALLESAGWTFPLFAHQARAIRAAARGDTLVVSAGTGSGKTESFLVPLLDRLHWDHERGHDDLDAPGVRAIIVYPLNALVNNQVDRLRGVLGAQSRIRFAFYTSRLPKSYSEATEAPPACQIGTRLGVRGLPDPSAPASDRPGPPHILITNFSMLEYMLIRPSDQSLFRPDFALHRGRARLRAVVLDEAHVYAGAQAAEIHLLLRRAAHRFHTELSALQGYATSATLDDRDGALPAFARSMFDTPAERVTAVTGRRHLPTIPEAPALAHDLPTELPDLAEVASVQFDAGGRPTALTTDPEGSRCVARIAEALGITDAPEAFAASHAYQPARVAWSLCLASAPMRRLRESLAVPGSERQALRTLFGTLCPGAVPPTDPELRAVARLLQVAAIARPSPEATPFLPTRVHVMARTVSGVWVKPPNEAGDAWRDVRVTPPDAESRLRALGGTTVADDVPWLPLRLCSCGVSWALISDDGELHAPDDASGPNAAIRTDPDGDDIPEWQARGTWVRLDETCACGEPIAKARPLTLDPQTCTGAVVDAMWSAIGAHPTPETRPGQGRRALVFSDSRQGAARLAAALERAHDVQVRRQIIYQSLPEGEAISFEAAARRIIEHPRFAECLVAMEHPRAPRIELARALLVAELGRPPATGESLEQLGLVEVAARVPTGPASIDAARWSILVHAVLDRLRSASCTTYPNLGSAAEYVDHHPRWMRLSEGTPSDGRATTTLTGRATNPLVTWLEKVGETQRLPQIFEALRASTDGLIDVDGDAIRLRVAALSLRRHPAPPWLDAHNRHAGFRVLDGHAPGRGDGSPPRPMHPPDADEQARWRARHAVQRVLDPTVLGLRTAEHSAQIDPNRLGETEATFRDARVNLLSCSTTLEMGIDLGGLTAVFLANVPPAPANYAQRAGRAGRRADGSSLVVTVAGARGHDQLVFADPMAFWARPTRAPQVRLDATPVVTRHANAALLTTYFQQQHPEVDAVGGPMRAFGSVGDFALGEAPAAERFLAWLAAPGERPSIRWLTDRTALDQVPPGEIADACARALGPPLAALRESLRVIDVQRTEGRNDPDLLAALAAQADQITSEPLIAWLARVGFLPRLGFPVDVVRLDARWRDATSHPNTGPLRLERSLDLALAEYAPGNELVADKRVLTSQGLVRHWAEPRSGQLQRRHFLDCDACGHLAVSDATLATCPGCGTPARAIDRQADTAPTGATVCEPFLRPSSFAVAWTARQPRYAGGPLDREGRAAVQIASRAADLPPLLPGLLDAAFTAHETLLVRAEGRPLDPTQEPGRGYAVCPRCGYAEPENIQPNRPHTTLRGGATCPETALWRHQVLGTEVTVDTLRVRLRHPADLRSEDVHLTLAACLSVRAGAHLHVDPRELRPTVARAGDRHDAVLLEAAESGLLAALRDDLPLLIGQIADDLDDPARATAYVRFETQHLWDSRRLRLDALRAALDADRETWARAAQRRGSHHAPTP